MVIMEIQNVFTEAEEINVYNEGVKVTYSSENDNYKKILECWNNTIENSYQMPAFGVSINNYTVEEMKHGLWVEFCFGKQIEHSQLLYNSSHRSRQVHSCGQAYGANGTGLRKGYGSSAS